MKKIICLLCWLILANPAFSGFVEGEAAFSSKRYSEAMQILRPLADQGDFRAQYYVAYMYLNGYGVTKNDFFAVEYLRKSVKQNYHLAQALMGFLYAQGEGVPQDYEQAAELYQKAADQGNTSAMLNLAVMHYLGNGMPRNLTKAIELLEDIPLDEQPSAGRYLGDVYMARDQVASETVIRAYQSAAYAGDLLSYIALAKIYLNGSGVPVDVKRAERYYQYAAAQGNAQAQYELGVLYVNGTGLDLNPALGYAWLSYAASQDYEPAVAAVNQLKGDMTLSDQEKSRQEFLHLQETVLGKVTAPIREEDLLEKKENTKSEETGRISRRRRRRRR